MEPLSEDGWGLMLAAAVRINARGVALAKQDDMTELVDAAIAERAAKKAADARVAELEALIAEAAPHIDNWNFPLTLGQRMRDAVKHLPEEEDA